MVRPAACGDARRWFGWTGMLVEGDQGKVEYAGRRFPRATPCALDHAETVTISSRRTGKRRSGSAQRTSMAWTTGSGGDHRLQRATRDDRIQLAVRPDRAVTVPYDRSSIAAIIASVNTGVVSAMTHLGEQGLSPRRCRAAASTRSSCARRGTKIPACETAHVYRILTSDN